MPLFPIPIEEFGGLDLTNDPSEVGFSGAIDLLNVDLNQRGRVRSRWGCAKFTTVPAATAYTSLFPWTAGGYLLAQRGGHIDALNTSGAVAASATVVGILGSATAFGTPAGASVYVGYGDGGTVRKWDGAAWSDTTLGGTYVAASTTDSRLVYAGGTLGGSRVKFSDPGAPTTIGANNFVDLDPGDGESITGMVSWRELLFVFKQSKFFVFYGTGIDASGNPIFNYRPIRSGIGAAAPGANGASSGSQMVCGGPDGVYFVNPRGIYRTSGGTPELVSGALDPLFLGEGISSFYTAGQMDLTTVPGPSIAWHRDRLFFSCNTNTFVFDPALGWTVWGGLLLGGPSGLASWGINTATTTIPDLYFSSGTDVYKYGSAYTTDNGTAITSRYQSGFDNLAPPRRFAAHYLFGNTRKRFRKWKVTGTGNVTLGIAHEMGAIGPTQALTLGVSPAIKDAWFNKAVRGQLVSYRLSSATPFSVNKLTAYLAGSEPPLLGDPSDA